VSSHAENRFDTYLMSGVRAQTWWEQMLEPGEIDQGQ
jgi:hypothetical protein